MTNSSNFVDLLYQLKHTKIQIDIHKNSLFHYLCAIYPTKLMPCSSLAEFSIMQLSGFYLLKINNNIGPCFDYYMFMYCDESIILFTIAFIDCKFVLSTFSERIFIYSKSEFMDDIVNILSSVLHYEFLGGFKNKEIVTMNYSCIMAKIEN